MPDSNPDTSQQVQRKVSCFACEGCALCTGDCCSDCVNEVCEAGDLFYCECSHACGPSVDYLKKVGIDEESTG